MPSWEQALERELDDLLRLTDDVRVCRRVEEHGQNRESDASLREIGLCEGDVGQNSNTSPGW